MAGEKIRVLIVDDIAETRDNLKRMLSFDQGIEDVAVGKGHAREERFACVPAPVAAQPAAPGRSG